MIALTNSILEKSGEYIIEVYILTFFESEAYVTVDLKIFSLNMFMPESIECKGKTIQGSLKSFETRELALSTVEQHIKKYLDDIDNKQGTVD